MVNGEWRPLPYRGPREHRRPPSTRERTPSPGRAKAPGHANALGAAVVTAGSRLVRLVVRLLSSSSFPSSAPPCRKRKGGTPKADPSNGIQDGPPSAFRAGFFDLAAPEPLRGPDGIRRFASSARSALALSQRRHGLSSDTQTDRSADASYWATGRRCREVVRDASPPEGHTPQTPPAGVFSEEITPRPRTIPAIVRPVRWAGGEGMMGDARGGWDFFRWGPTSLKNDRQFPAHCDCAKVITSH